jgi:hypothetical protein
VGRGVPREGDKETGQGTAEKGKVLRVREVGKAGGGGLESRKEGERGRSGS